MKANRNQTGASPRFTRGLALLAVVGALALLAYGGLSKRTEGRVPTAAGESTTVETQSQSVRREYSTSRTFSVSAVHAKRWTNRFTAIQAEPDLNGREKQWANLLAEVSFADIPAVLDELQTAGLGAHEFSQRLLRRWAEAEGRAAATWAERLPAGAARDSSLTGVAIEWANADLKPAAEWAQQLENPAERQTTLLTIANEAVRTEPMEALRLAVELPANDDRDEVIRHAATEWALQDGPGAVEWAKGIPDPALRNATLAAEVIAWSETEPEAAATFAVKTLPPGRLLEDTVVSIAQRWAQQQPQLAAAWVAQFPPGNLKAAAAENVAAMWAQQNPSVAEAGPETGLIH